jgi:hypothetical protein
MICTVLRYWPFGGRQFSPEIERVISRRRLAAWTAVAAMMTIAVAGGAGPDYFYGLVLALWAVAVAFAAAQTIRLRRRGVATVWFLDSWFRPIRPGLIADRDNPYRPFWLVRLILLIGLLCAFVFTLPNQVNSVAYLTGQAPTVSFLPQFQSRQCAKDNPASCTTQTTGILGDTGTRVVYPGALAIGRPVLVRPPLWRWPSGQQLVTSGNAAWLTLLGMIIDVTLASIMSGYVVRWLGRRSPGLPWRPRPVPEEDLVPVPGDARPANWSTRNTARKKLEKQHRKR